MKNIGVFYLKIFSFLEMKCSIYLNRHVFVMQGCKVCSYGQYRLQGFPSEIYLRGYMSLLTRVLGDILGNFRG